MSISDHDAEQRILGEMLVYEKQAVFWRDRLQDAIERLAIYRTRPDGTVTDIDEPDPLTEVEFGPDKLTRRRGKYRFRNEAWVALVEAGPRGVTARYLTEMTGVVEKTTSSWLSQIMVPGFATKVEKKGQLTRYFILPEDQWPRPVTANMFMHRQFEIGLPEPS